MSLTNNANASEILRTQKTAKPKIEEVIPEYLDGDLQKAALDFVAHLRSVKLNPAWRSANGWQAMCKGKTICVIKMPRGPYDNEFDQPWMPKGDRSRNYWAVSLYLDHLDEYEGTIADEALQEAVWSGTYFCNSCNNNPCTPGRDITVLGRELKGVCRVRRRWYYNPDAASVHGIKRLLDLEKEARTNRG